MAEAQNTDAYAKHTERCTQGCLSSVNTPQGTLVCTECAHPFITLGQLTAVVAEHYRPDHALALDTLAVSLACAMQFDYPDVWSSLRSSYHTPYRDYPERAIMPRQHSLAHALQEYVRSMAGRSVVCTEAEFAEAMEAFTKYTKHVFGQVWNVFGTVETFYFQQGCPLSLYEHLLTYTPLEVIPRKEFVSGNACVGLCAVHDPTDLCALTAFSSAHDHAWRSAAVVPRADSGYREAHDYRRLVPEVWSHYQHRLQRIANHVREAGRLHGDTSLIVLGYVRLV